MSAHRDILKLVGAFLFVMAASLAASFFVSGTTFIILVVALVVLCAFVYRPVWGIYAFAFAAPLSGLIIDFSHSETLSRIPYLGSVNAPAADFLAIMLLLVCGILVILKPRALHWHTLVQTPVWVFALWFLAIAASVYFAEQQFFTIAIKSFARPYVFAYAAFVIPILLLVRRRAELEGALLAYEIACFGGAIMGAISIFIVPYVGFPRAQPFEIFGFAPFGVNHNILAEALTAIIPFAFYYAYTRTGVARVYAYVGAIAIAGVSLATFSRAAWIVVAVQLVCWFMHWRTHHSHMGRVAKKWFVALAVVAVVFSAFFVWIQSTAIAANSDATRTDLLGIAITYFHRAPWFGQGPGTFMPLVSDTKIFRMQYGDALDAHGVFEKILTETGVVGTVAFVLVLGVILWELWRRRSDTFEYMLFVTILSVWTYQLFNTGYFAAKVWVLIAIALVSIAL